jgi:hypothetical protein
MKFLANGGMSSGVGATLVRGWGRSRFVAANGFAPVRSCRDQLQVGLGADQAGDAVTDNFVIVRGKNSNHNFTLPFRRKNAKEKRPCRLA